MTEFVHTTKSQEQFAEMIVRDWLDYQLELYPENIYFKQALDLLKKPVPKGYNKHVDVFLVRNNIDVYITTPDCSDTLLCIKYCTYNPNKTKVRLKENNCIVKDCSKTSIIM